MASARGSRARTCPSTEDKEPTSSELQALVARTLAFVEGLDASGFDASAAREIVTWPGTPKQKKFTGQAYLLNYGLPQFFFHLNTTYALFRHNGVEVGKRDYMGNY